VDFNGVFSVDAYYIYAFVKPVEYDTCCIPVIYSLCGYGFAVDVMDAYLLLTAETAYMQAILVGICESDAGCLSGGVLYVCCLLGEVIFQYFIKVVRCIDVAGFYNEHVVVEFQGRLFVQRVYMAFGVSHIDYKM
jgi:hypothetical protein